MTIFEYFGIKCNKIEEETTYTLKIDNSIFLDYNLLKSLGFSFSVDSENPDVTLVNLPKECILESSKDLDQEFSLNEIPEWLDFYDSERLISGAFYRSINAFNYRTLMYIRAKYDVRIKNSNNNCEKVYFGNPLDNLYVSGTINVEDFSDKDSYLSEKFKLVAKAQEFGKRNYTLFKDKFSY